MLPVFALTILSGCSNEAEQAREWCRKAAKIAGSLCVEADRGEDGDVFISIYTTSDGSNVNLAEFGGSSSAKQDGSLETVTPGTGYIYWSSDSTEYYQEVTMVANPGYDGKYSILIKPPGGSGSKGDARTYKMLLSGNYYSFVYPDD